MKDEGPRLLQKYYLQYCNKKKEAGHGFTGAESHPGLMEVMQKNRDESDLIFYQSIEAFAVSHFLEHVIGRRGWGQVVLIILASQECRAYSMWSSLLFFFPFRKSTQQITPQALFLSKWTFLRSSSLFLVSCNHWPTWFRKEHVSHPILPHSILWLVNIMAITVITTVTVSTIICSSYKLFLMCQTLF